MCIKFHLSRYIVGVDINDGKFPSAVSMGATECVNRKENPDIFKIVIGYLKLLI